MSLSPQKLRLEALNLATNDFSGARITPSDVIARAEAYYAFLNGSAKTSAAVARAKVKITKPALAKLLATKPAPTKPVKRAKK